MIEVWKYIADLPGQTAALYDWNRQLGKWPAYPAFRQRFLQPTCNRAMSITCPTDCGLSCPRRVHVYSPERIIANCPEREEGPLQLGDLDVLIYKVNGPALRREICQALEIAYHESKVEGCRLTWRLGNYIWVAGKVFPVYFTHQDDAEEFCEVTRHLCLLAPGPFAVIAPLRRDLSPIAEGLLERHKSLFLALSEELVFTDEALPKAVREPEDVFRALIGETAQTDSGGITGYNTPPGISWEQISIQFRDGHTVAVRVGNAEPKIYSNGDMGMVNTKNNKPTKQWKLLEALAQLRGKLGWDDPASNRKLEKQKQELSRRLRDFFHLEDEPIEWLVDRKVYQCRFQILPDGGDDYSPRSRGRRA